MSKEQAVKRAEAYFDQGRFFDILERRVALPTESQNPERIDEIRGYLTDEIQPCLTRLGFTCRVLENPVTPRLPMLVAERKEDPDRPTVLIYGHGDVVLGMEDRWTAGQGPWRLTVDGDRWYGRGTADNKGQHSVNLAALENVLEERGRLGFNCRVIIEMGEESGSPGLHEFCRQHKDLLSADVLIASDGPRLIPDRPMLYLGNRGVVNFDLKVKPREGSHHSGNWGGLLSNPGVVLAHAIACLIDRHGRILVPELTPRAIPEDVREALSRVQVTGEGGPAIDPRWGEPGLSLAEKVFGWNSMEVLAFVCGNPQRPIHAVPDEARARIHMRFVPETDPKTFLPAIRRHLDRHGFEEVEACLPEERFQISQATRPALDQPWVQWGRKALSENHQGEVTFLPNLGGTLPNDAFTDILGLPTLWFPHSYAGCSQHAPDEHVLAAISRQALLVMTGIFYDLGDLAEAPAE